MILLNKKAAALTSLTLLTFLSLNIFMLSYCIHIIRDIDQAECIHAALISFMKNQSSTYDIANLILNNFDKGANLAGIFPFSLFYVAVASIGGVSYISLKMTPLLFHAATFLLLSLIIKKHFNFRTLSIFCLFYVFAPLFMYKWNLTFWAAHPESAFFSALVLYLSLSTTRPTTIGLTAGFCLYMSFFCLPVIMAVIIYKAFFQRQNLKNFLLKFIPAFALGFLPWIMFRLTYQKPLGPDETGLIFLFPDASNIATRLMAALFNAPFFGPVFDRKFTAAAIIAKYIQHIFFLTLIPLSAPKLLKNFNFNKKQKEIIQITAMTIGLYFLAVIASSHNQAVYDIASHAPRYFVALFPFFFLTAAVFIPKLFKMHKLIKILCLFVCLLYISVNIYDYQKFISLGQKEAFKTYKGLRYYFTGINSVELKKAPKINTAIKLLKGTPYLAGFAQVFNKKSGARYKTLPYYSENTKTLAELTGDLQNYGKEQPTNITREEFMEGFGYGLVIQNDWNKTNTMNFINRYGKEKDRAYLKKGADLAFTHQHLY